jgi:glyoxylase-like metal-dependent hydrolase (beta-lactamase superfamily II)/rhodanese-related sulfurtransferase
MTILQCSPAWTVDELLVRLESSDSPLIVDVREEDEYLAWHIPGAQLFPLGELADRLNEISRDRHIVTVCAAGLRAAKGANILASAGYEVSVLTGGMESWGQAYETVATQLEGATVVQVRRRGKGCLSYLIGSVHGAVVIDPSIETARYLDIAEQYGFAITHVLDTHLHADHLSGARELAQQSGATLLLNPADPFAYDFTPIVNDLRIALSDDLHLTVSAVSTPGHTEGSTVYRLGDVALFTGDTLFLESVGRPDLADQAELFAHSLYRSLHDVVLKLPDDMLIFPAHYGDAVDVHSGQLVTKQLGELRRTLPALAFDEGEFVTWAVARVTDRPANYMEIVRYNSGHSTKSLHELRTLELGPNRCAIAN